MGPIGATGFGRTKKGTEFSEADSVRSASSCFFVRH
jgi:hypothetical protein